MDNNTNQRSNQGAGRISSMHENNKEQAHHSGDISDVDRQEGEMENGELGGNFNVAGSKPNDKPEAREEKENEAPPY
jgi:hypothetical protein